MLSIEETHRILNSASSEESFTKDEALRLRDFLNEFAELGFDAFNKEVKHNESSKLIRKKSHNLL